MIDWCKTIEESCDPLIDCVEDFDLFIGRVRRVSMPRARLSQPAQVGHNKPTHI